MTRPPGEGRAREMPLHRPVRWFIECSCGAKVDRDRYDRHLHDGFEELGRWVADGILAAARDAIAERPA